MIPGLVFATPSSLRPMHSDPFVGASLGPYRITRKLGQGGMGVVYHAIHDLLKVEVAVKLLPSHLATNEQYRARFFREAKAAATLDHPNVVRVLDAGFDEKTSECYLIMAFCEGDSLRDRLARPWPIQQALPLFVPMCDALLSAHDRGMIHRDVKPDNVLFTAQGVPQLSDFGLARMESSTSALTQTGQVLGTPPYMPLEQWDGDNVGPSADQYALGVTFYEVLTLDLPIWAETPSGYVRRLVGQQRTPIFERKPAADLPRRLGDAVERMTAIDPGDRFETLMSAREELVAVAIDLKISLQIDPGSAPRRVAKASTPTWTDISDRPTAIQQISIEEGDLSVFPLRQAGVHNSLAGTPKPPVPSELQTQAVSSMVGTAFNPDAPTAVRPRKRGIAPLLIGLFAGLLLAGLVAGGAGVLLMEQAGGPDGKTTGSDRDTQDQLPVSARPTGTGSVVSRAPMPGNHAVEPGDLLDELPGFEDDWSINGELPNTFDGNNSGVYDPADEGTWRTDREFILANRALTLIRAGAGSIDVECDLFVVHPNGWQGVMIARDELAVVEIQRNGGEIVSEFSNYANGLVAAAAFHPDGEAFYTGDSNGSLVRWTFEDDELGSRVDNPQLIEVFADPIRSLACVGNHVLLVGTDFGECVLLDASRVGRKADVEAEVLAVLSSHNAGTRVSDVWLAPDGLTAVTAGGDRRVCLWDLTPAFLRADDDGDGTAACEDTVEIGDAGDGGGDEPRAPVLKPIRSVDVGNPLNAVAVSLRNGLVVCGDHDGNLSVLRLDYGGFGDEWTVVQTLKAHPSSIESLAFNKGETLLVSGGDDDTLQLLTPVDEAGLDMFGRSGQAAQLARLTDLRLPDNANAHHLSWTDTNFGAQTLVVAASFDGIKVITLAPEGHEFDRALPMVVVGDARVAGGIRSLDIGEQGQWAVAVNTDGQAFFIHRDGQSLPIETTEQVPVAHALLIPGRDTESPAAAVACVDGTIQIYAVLSKASVRFEGQLTGVASGVTCMAISPARWLVAGGREGELAVWRLNENDGGGDLIGMTQRKGAIYTVAIDGTTVYSEGESDSLIQWRIATERLDIDRYIDEVDDIQSLHIAPGGQIVSHSVYGAVRATAPESAEQADPNNALPGRERFADLVRYADVGGQAVAFGIAQDPTDQVIIWSPAGADDPPEYMVASPVRGTTAIAVSRDGLWLVAGNGSGRIRFVSIAPQSIGVAGDQVEWGLDLSTAFVGDTDLTASVALKPNRMVTLTVTNNGDAPAMMVRAQVEFYSDLDDGELLMTMPVMLGMIGSGETVTRTIAINVDRLRRDRRRMNWPELVARIQDASGRGTSRAFSEGSRRRGNGRSGDDGDDGNDGGWGNERGRNRRD